MVRKLSLTPVEYVLLATAFAAGAVDIIGFANLGGVFASAMTGNFALLAYHVAQGNSRSAIGSVIALAGFVLGCAGGFTLRRRRISHDTLRLLLRAEAALLLVFALLAMSNAHSANAVMVRVQIAMLALAMGLQAVVGQATSLSTFVFTTTLTRLVGGITDYLAAIDSPGRRDIKRLAGVVVWYLFGALFAGVLTVHEVAAVAFLPLAGVVLALVAHRRSTSA
jgi:uncharacterized membrane protein YoaK (UPF0700 family)